MVYAGFRRRLTFSDAILGYPNFTKKIISCIGIIKDILSYPGIYQKLQGYPGITRCGVYKPCYPH